METTLNAREPAFGIGGLLRRALADRRHYRQACRELESYSNDELAELGLMRADIPRVARATMDGWLNR